jgi:hypothetical protein
MLRFKWIGAAILAATAALGVHAQDAVNRGITDSTVTTLVGGAGDGVANAKNAVLYLEGGLTRDTSGNIYFTDYHRVMKLTPAGALSTVAGQVDNGSFSGDGGPASGALLYYPWYLATDASNNIYVYDYSNYRIRKITASTGIITTVAGNGNNTNTLVGINQPATSVSLPYFDAMAVNAAGDIFLASNNTRYIYKIPAATGKLTLIAGNGQNVASPGGLPALFNPLGGQVRGMAIASDGTLIYSANNAIRQIDASGNNNIIAGLINDTTNKVVQNAGAIFPDDGTQDALQVMPATGGVNNPQQIAVDGSNIFFWDSSIGRVRKFTIGGKIQTVFGEVGENYNSTGFRGDGILAAPNTPAPAAPPYDPTKTNDDPMADLSNNQLVAAGGVVTMADGGLIRQFTVGGNVNTIAGATNGFADYNGAGYDDSIAGTTISNNVPVPGIGAPLYNIGHVTRSSAGVFFSAQDYNTGNSGIYKYDAASGNVSLVAGVQYVNGRRAIPGEGNQATSLSISLDRREGQVAALPNGGFLFSESNFSNVLRAVDANGKITTVAGNGDFGNQNSAGTAADQNLRAPETPVATTQYGVPADTFPRVGKKATDIQLMNISGKIGTSPSDFIIGTHGNGGVFRLLQVTGGVVTMDFTPAMHPDILVQSGNFIFVATFSSSGANQQDIHRIDITDPTTPVEAVFATPTGSNIIGLAMGSRGLYCLDSTGNIRVFLTAQLSAAAGTLPQAPTAATNAAALVNGTFAGLAATGTTIYAMNNNNNTVVSLTDDGTDAANSIGTLTTVAGPVMNTKSTSPWLSFDFDFDSGMTLLSDGRLLVGNENINQYFAVTLGATAPDATATAVIGTSNFTPIDQTALNSDNLTVNALAADANGVVYFSDDTYVVRRVNAGNVETYLGTPNFNLPLVPGLNRQQTTIQKVRGLAFNAAGELHAALVDDQVVVKVDSNNNVQVVFGQPQKYGHLGDGFPGTQATLANPRDIVFNPNGDLYVVDDLGGRLLSKDNIVSTLFNDDTEYVNIALDAAGKVYLGGSDTNSGSNIHRFTTGVNQGVIVVAGSADGSGGFNGDGLPANKTFFDTDAMDIAFDPALGLLVADQGNNRLRVITNLAETTNTAPIAVIIASAGSQGSVPFKVSFDGSTSTDPDNDIVNYVWDFGDGTTGVGPLIEHTYSQMGSFNVTLTVTDSAGQSSTTGLANGGSAFTVIAALPMISSSSTGKGSFKVAFGPKATKPSDSFSLSMTNVAGLTNQSGKSAVISIGTFTASGTVAGKGVKSTSKTVKLTVDPVKKTVSISVKGVKLGAALAALGVLNENTVAPGKSVLIPVVVNINNGALVVGDKFLFFYKGKFNSNASGKFSQ